MILEINNIHKSYSPQVNVLKGLSLSLKTGAFESIMGASGSGKSTLLHLIAGLLSATSGSVKIGGNDTDGMSDDEMTCFRRRNIGLIFQNFNLIPTLTVEENITLPLLLDRALINQVEVDKLLLRFDLSARRRHLPEKLSGGEQQRVAIARALITKPYIILADEPTGNLDSAAGSNFCDLLTSINKEDSCTILMISHDPIVTAISTKVHILKDGVLSKSFNTEHNVELISNNYLNIMKEL